MRKKKRKLQVKSPEKKLFSIFTLIKAILFCGIWELWITLNFDKFIGSLDNSYSYAHRLYWLIVWDDF